MSQVAVIDRAPSVVFDYLADMGHLPEWMPEDFKRVTQESSGPISTGTRFHYPTSNERVESEFSWVDLQRPKRMTWHGPPVEVGPLGRVEGAGTYDLQEAGGSTRVTVTIAPRFGGVLRVSPL